MGIHKEVRKLFGSSILNYIISARTAQGYEQWKSSTKEERMDIIGRWHEHKGELQSARQKVLEDGPEGQESGRLSPRGFLQTRHLSFEERKKLHEDRRKRREEEKNKLYGERGSRCPFCTRTSTHQHQELHSAPEESIASGVVPETHEEFESAIKASVAATSRGNPEEDIMIERAIRASVRELQASSDSGSGVSEHDAMDRAIKASIAEANKGRNARDSSAEPLSDAEFNAILEKSLQQSLHDSQSTGITLEDNDVDTDDDEDMKRAIAASKTAHEQKAKDGKSEEEIVLEYIKKQSLAEEEHRKAVQGKGKAVAETGEVSEDEDLKRALEESMKTV